MSTGLEIRLVGPGGAGKTTIGAGLAQTLQLPFVDLDRSLAGRVGDISEYIQRHGYDVYARENVETYCSILDRSRRPGVAALSSGFMTYARGIHPEYARVRRELEHHPATFVLLPSFDREACVAETVRRQTARPFGRSSAAEEAVIRARFDVYMALPMRKVETMRPVAAAVGEIVAALSHPTVRAAELRFANRCKALGTRVLECAAHQSRKEKPMTNTGVTADHEVTIRTYLEAFEARDLARCLELYNPDATINFQFSAYEGTEAIAAWHRDRFDADLRVMQIEGIVPEGDAVQVHALVASKRLRAWRFETLSVTLDFDFANGRIRTLDCGLRTTPW